jgi:zinc transporter ZupT
VHFVFRRHQADFSFPNKNFQMEAIPMKILYYKDLRSFAGFNCNVQVHMNDFIFFSVGMFVATIVASLLPLTLVSSSGHSRKLILSLCSCFSGGVFLSALFLDLMPDTKEAWDSVLDEYQKTYKIVIDYPVQQFVLCFGFFLVFIIEQMILEYKEGLHTQRGPIREAR